ncbi:MAG: cadherin-like beta sandwich domain-containing protein [Bacilli bacterium]
MKKISLFIFTTFISLLMLVSVNAATATINVTSSRSRVIVGETVTITIKIASSSNLGVWQFDVAPSSNLSLVSSSFGGLYIKDYATSSTQKSSTYTFVFKAKASGTATVNIKNSLVYDYDEKEISSSNGSVSFKTMTQGELEDSYSKNNNLKDLSVKDFTLTPAFNKDVLEYNLEVGNDIKTINLNATKEDNTASINGIGDIAVSEGLNALKVIVTAQNGSTKTYTINVTVKELKPIEVKIDGNIYTVVRKKEFLPPAKLYYKEEIININEEQVPSYYLEKAKLTLVALKDTKGVIKLYIYDDGSYKEYLELSFNQIVLYTMPVLEKELPKGYEKVNLKIGQNSVIGYKTTNSNYPLVYGMNLETGVKSLYRYDANDNTLQRYEELNSKENLYFIIIIVLFVVLIITYILGSLLLFKRKGKKKVVEKTIEMAKL